MELLLIRHGQTPGNAQRRYVGAIDMPLSEGAQGGAPTAGGGADMELLLIRHGQTPGNAQRRYVGAIDMPLSEGAQGGAPTAGGGADMELLLIRHGQTPGNAQRRYVGAIDMPLSEKGRMQAQEAGRFPQVERVYVSTLKRSHETAAIMFPNAEQIVVDGVQEMDFGDFAGRTADEMEFDAAYREWVDSGCTLPCPNGESRASFTRRVCDSLEALLRDARARGEQRVILVAHGGTMMAALDTFADDPRSYFEWHVGNCEGYRIEVAFTHAGMRFTPVESGRLAF